MNYNEFLEKKKDVVEPSGFDVSDELIPEKLYPFQKAIVNETVDYVYEKQAE